MNRPDGRATWLDLAAVRISGGVSLSVRDVSKQVRLQLELTAAVAELERIALRDPLTGLANRRAWTAELARHLDTARRTGAPLAVALLDLDLFKAYNDTWGHVAGDDLLVQVADRWQRSLPAGATLARLGGEEFGLALPQSSADSARAVVAALLTLVPDGQTSSAGLTVWDRVEDERSVLGRADAALYVAKRGGRNRVDVLLPLLPQSAVSSPAASLPPSSHPSGAANS